jgi:hypothetical protein
VLGVIWQYLDMEDDQPKGDSSATSIEASSDVIETAKTSSEPAMLRRFIDSLFTILTLILVLSTVWCLVGSLWFPVWWYDAIFRGDLFDGSYLLYGINYLQNDQPGLLVLLAIVLVVLIALAYWKRALLERLFQPKRSLIVATCFGTIILIFAILNFTEHGQMFFRWRNFDAQGSLAYSNALLDAVIEETGSNQAPREFTPPIVFRYLDDKALEGLYGEIEPALVEEERKVSTESGKKVEGKVKLGVESVASAEGSAGSDTKQELSSSFKRTSGSPERRALELINYCLKSRRLIYYSTSDAWYLDISVREARQKLFAYHDEKPKHDPTLIAAGNSSDPVVTKEPSDEAKAKQNRWDQILNEELEKLGGLVLVDGTFDVIRTDKGIDITHHFSNSPHRVSFKADISSITDNTSWKSGTRLRVLGYVLRPLGKDGTVWLQPIAIF